MGYDLLERKKIEGEWNEYIGKYFHEAPVIGVRENANEKKFIAAMQGVDLDAGSGSQKEWEDMKARVFSKGQATDGNDILAYQGATASKAGFGVGMGIDYEVVEG